LPPPVEHSVLPGVAFFVPWRRFISH